MAIIVDTIDKYLSKKYVDRVVVTGLDASGKSTMITQLTGKYKYIKYSLDGENPINYDFTWDYQLFDRYPLIDQFVYAEHEESDQFNQAYLDYLERSVKKYIPRTLFVIYLHNMFLYLKPNEPEWVMNNLKRTYDRFLLVVQRLDKMKVPLLVVMEKSFFLKHGVYDYIEKE